MKKNLQFKITIILVVFLFFGLLTINAVTENKCTKTGCDGEFEWVTIKDPTCDEDGYRVQECNECGTQGETKTISAGTFDKSHDFNQSIFTFPYIP